MSAFKNKVGHWYFESTFSELQTGNLLYLTEPLNREHCAGSVLMVITPLVTIFSYVGMHLLFFIPVCSYVHKFYHDHPLVFILNELVIIFTFPFLPCKHKYTTTPLLLNTYLPSVSHWDHFKYSQLLIWFRNCQSS